MRKLIILTLTLVFTGLFVLPASADGGGGSNRDSRLAPFQELIEDEKFQQAIEELKQALEEDSDDADLLNLIAYSHRQLKHYDIALTYYQQALQIEPDHRGANEYLGELFLQLGQLKKAQQRLAVLDKECFFGCDEFDELEQAIEQYQKQNPS